MMAGYMFTDEPVIVEEEPDLQSMFARILWKEDWTDKASSALGRIFHHSSEDRNSGDDTELPDELGLLVPDMKEVEQAYVELTSGYMEFIRTVWEAQQFRKQQQNARLPHRHPSVD